LRVIVFRIDALRCFADTDDDGGQVAQILLRKEFARDCQSCRGESRLTVGNVARKDEGAP